MRCVKRTISVSASLSARESVDLSNFSLTTPLTNHLNKTGKNTITTMTDESILEDDWINSLGTLHFCQKVFHWQKIKHTRL